MAKKITLNDLDKKIDALTAIVDRSFAATDTKFMVVADDIADIKRAMATKEQILALQTQVTSIEQQLRDTRIEARLGNPEEKVFGAPHR